MIIKMKKSLSALDGSWGAGQSASVPQEMSPKRAAELIKIDFAEVIEPTDDASEALVEAREKIAELQAQIVTTQGLAANAPQERNAAKSLEDLRAEIEATSYADQKELAKAWGLTFVKTPKKEELLEALLEEAAKRDAENRKTD